MTSVYAKLFKNKMDEKGYVMNIDYLREFTELAKHLSFTETARILNMSQPTLSKHMGQFEKELKLTLFERVGNSLRLTKAGGALLPYAYQITDAQRDFSEKVIELRKAPPPRLTISGLTDEGPSTEVLGFMISLLSEKYGPNFLEVKSRFNRNPCEMLGANEVEIVYDPAPIEESLDEEHMDALHLADLGLVAIVDQNHRLAQKDSISLDDLRNEVFLKYEGLYIVRSWSYVETACRNHGFVPKTQSIHCASITELFAQCVSLKSSVLIVGTNFGNRIPSGIKPFCKVLPIEDDDAVIPFHFIYRKDNKNPVLQDAINMIKEMPEPALRFS